MLFAVGCTLYGESADDEQLVPSPPSTRGDADAGDAGDVNATGTKDGGTNGGGLDSSLVPNPSFESSGVACAPGWSITGGSAETVATAHGGAKACRVCTSSGEVVALASRITPESGQYVVEAWFRADDSAGVPITPYVQFFAFDGAGNGIASALNDGIAEAKWTKAQAAVTLDESAKILDVIVGAYRTDGARACVIVDDVLVVRY